MRDPDREHDECVVECLVHDAVVPDAHAPQAQQLSLEGTSLEWLFTEPIYFAHDPPPFSLRHPSEVPGGALLDPNRVAHP